MAETAVCFVLEKILPLISAETELLGGLQRNFIAINNELRIIKVFLKDAEQISEDNDIISEWVRQVRSIAFQIEDVIDEYLMIHHNLHGESYQILSPFTKLYRFLLLLRRKHRIASTMKQIHVEIIEINRRRRFFAFGRGADKESYECVNQDPRAGFVYVDESELVGIDGPKRDIIRLLCDQTQGTMVSVVGMGGLGKSTLVRKVYEDRSMKSHFPLRAWITLSRPARAVDVIRNMFKQFLRAALQDSIPPSIDTMDEESLVEELRNSLQEQRFLVVFDDVWDIETYMRDILPNNNNGSKILMTTRLSNVALAWKKSSDDHIYKLQSLSPQKSWDLFCRKAFQSHDVKCPPELENLSRDIVRKCEGLPLAIVTIGGLLSTKNKLVFEWQKLYNSIGAELSNNRHLASIKKILLLSYHDLPHHLKLCFLYMGIFPCGHSIERKRLFRLWIAEDFIPMMSGKTLEDVADEYLIELIHRSLVQVTSVDIAGSHRTVRVHDLLREIILLKSDELSFSRVFDRNLLGDAQSRRLVIQNSQSSSNDQVGFEKTTKRSSVRSLFLFEGHEAVPKLITGSFLRTFPLLKVLDLQTAPVTEIPEAIGSLYHLQLLSLKHTKVKKVPRSIGKLINLQTLELRFSLVQELPTEISRLLKLRHLIAFSHHWDDTFSLYVRNVRAIKIPAEVCNNSRELQSLGWVDTSVTINFTKQIKNLKELRRLGLARLKQEDGRSLCDAINNMNHLLTLMIFSKNKDEFLDVDHISSPPPMLHRLFLMGRLEKLPHWISTLKNIVKLVLCHSGLTLDPFGVFGALPNLMKLILSEAYSGEDLRIGVGMFQKLKVLRLYGLYNLKSVEIMPSALPVLEELELGPSPLLKEVPRSIKNLENLFLLRFHDMPKEFIDGISPVTGRYYGVIEHVPNVYINSIAGAGCWDTYSLRHSQDGEMVSYETSRDDSRSKRGSGWNLNVAPLYTSLGT